MSEGICLQTFAAKWLSATLGASLLCRGHFPHASIIFLQAFINVKRINSLAFRTIGQAFVDADVKQGYFWVHVCRQQELNLLDSKSAPRFVYLFLSSCIYCVSLGWFWSLGSVVLIFNPTIARCQGIIRHHLKEEWLSREFWKGDTAACTNPPSGRTNLFLGWVTVGGTVSPFLLLL